jgi:hypothetical protein
MARRVAISAVLLALIYLGAIPALFDLGADRAYVLPDGEFTAQMAEYERDSDVLIHDGPGLQASLASAPVRIAALEAGMARRNASRRRSLVPRWYAPYADRYYAIQRRSLIHLLYPFL